MSSSKLFWYAARSNGLVAWGVLAASMLWGLALSTKVLGRRPRSAWLLDMHRFLGGVAVVFTAIHVGTIMLDTYVSFGLLEVLVPLTGTWHPDAVAWGIAAMYLLVAVEVTSLVRTRMSRSAWRITHYLSFPLFALASTHSLTAGTDRHTPVMRWGIIGVCVAVALLTLVRVVTADRHDLMTTPALRPAQGQAQETRRV